MSGEMHCDFYRIDEWGDGDVTSGAGGNNTSLGPVGARVACHRYPVAGKHPGIVGSRVDSSGGSAASMLPCCDESPMGRGK